MARPSQACVSHKVVWYVLKVRNGDERSRKKSDWIETSLSVLEWEDEERTVAEKEGAGVGLWFRDAA